MRMVRDRIPGLSDGGELPPGYDPPSASLTPPNRAKSYGRVCEAIRRIRELEEAARESGELWDVDGELCAIADLLEEWLAVE
jgi:hypothetical protein